MNQEDIRAMTAEELTDNLRQERTALQRMRFANAVTPVENPNKLRAGRKTVARLLTEISARKRVEANQ